MGAGPSLHVAMQRARGPARAAVGTEHPSVIGLSLDLHHLFGRFDLALGRPGKLEIIDPAEEVGLGLIMTLQVEAQTMRAIACRRHRCLWPGLGSMK